MNAIKNQKNRASLVSVVVLAAGLILLWTPAARLWAQDSTVEFQSPDSTTTPVTPAENPAPPSVPAPGPTASASTPTNSLEFIMGSNPISHQAASPEITSGQPVSTIATPKPEFPLSSMVSDPEGVTMLVSENCTTTGDETSGTVTCNRVYSNRNHAQIISQHALEGDEFKQQAILEEYDSNDQLLYKKTVRHRVDYAYVHDVKTKLREFYDIVLQPTGKKTTREIMIYQYHLDTGKIKTMSWTQYSQIGNLPKASLAYYATLSYDRHGDPTRGLAEKWDQGQKIAIYMNWSRLQQGQVALDRDRWTDWEKWIQNVSLQAYLP